MITDELRLLPAQAAQVIRRHPVPDRGPSVPDMRLSVLAVLLHCAPLRGEAFVAFQVLQRRGLPGEYFLDPGHVDDAVALLDEIDVSDAECAATFGPNWRSVVGHAVDAASVLHEGFAVPTWTTGVVGSHRRLGAWACARDAACEAGRLESWYRAQDAAWERQYMDDATVRVDERVRSDVATAVRDAAAALAVADLAGTGDLTSAHLDTLLEPWRTGVGRLSDRYCAATG
ncbi:hypothetical protein [Rhodococcus sp. NCIMB 12038]|uniref:hypothetical protein n=1 Tax=Rhodococcus sp. NCIMB 12038 TaxID=933800 RepID=UPI000B3C368C|nr:hypothetical protein [Rhodococcus sp. NCIMB 12038]OUS95474.1 hypothetical protein CA951_12620 [Rhodococcus sp. NCIMB 12038]